MYFRSKSVKRKAMTDQHDSGTRSLGGELLEESDFGTETSDIQPEPIKLKDRAGLTLPDAIGAPVKARPARRRYVLAAVLLSAIAGGAYYGSYWWTEGRFLVSTDDAYVKANLSIISAKVSGIITDVPVKENTFVKAGDVLAQIDDRDYKNAAAAARDKLVTQDATIERLKQQAVAQQATIAQAKAQVTS